MSFEKPEPEQREDEETETRSGRKMDDELRSMAALLRELDGLDDRARARVVAWLHSRYTQER